MIRIITIEREYGSGAANISKTIAGKLGWKLWDKDITSEIAHRLHCNEDLVAQHEERVDSVFYRLVKVFMRGSFESRVGTPGLELLDAESLAGLFETVVQEIAEKGECVIIGRGAPWFLRERGDVFHVFLYAPHEEKLRRLIAAGEDGREAEHLLESVDRDRAAFICKYYSKEWPDRYLYNTMINTRVGDDAVIAAILQQVERLNGGTGNGVR